MVATVWCQLHTLMNLREFPTSQLEISRKAFHQIPLRHVYKILRRAGKPEALLAEP